MYGDTCECVYGMWNIIMPHLIHMYMPLYYCVPDRIMFVLNSTMACTCVEMWQCETYNGCVLLKGAATVYTCISLVPKLSSACE